MSAEKRLRDALESFAKCLIAAEDPTFSVDNCRTVLADAGIETTSDQFERARVVFGRLPFYGGNYTLDARRILKAIARAETSAQ